MKSNKETKKEKGFFKKLIDNVTENVKEGASLVSEKVSEVGEIVAGKSAKAYVAGSELVSETSDKIHDFTEKQGLQKEEKKLIDRQKALKFQFGYLTLEHYLKNDSLHKAFLTTKTVTNVVEEYKANEKRMNAITKAVKKLDTQKVMRYVLIFIYTVVNIFLFVLNWDLFTTMLDVDLGFGIYTVLPFLILQIFGLLILAIFAIVDGMKDLKRELKIVGLQNKVLHLEKDLEIALLKVRNNATVEEHEPIVTIIPEIEA